MQRGRAKGTKKTEKKLLSRPEKAPAPAGICLTRTGAWIFRGTTLQHRALTDGGLGSCRGRTDAVTGAPVAGLGKRSLHPRSSKTIFRFPPPARSHPPGSLKGADRSLLFFSQLLCTTPYCMQKSRDCQHLCAKFPITEGVIPFFEKRKCGFAGITPQNPSTGGS